MTSRPVSTPRKKRKKKREVREKRAKRKKKKRKEKRQKKRKTKKKKKRPYYALIPWGPGVSGRGSGSKWEEVGVNGWKWE